MNTTSLTSPNRRTFLKTSSALTVAGGGLMLGVSLGVPSAAQAAGTLYTPNAWVHIADDNTITLLSARSEMGQGVYTSMPMLIAEELNVELRKIKVAIAPPGRSTPTPCWARRSPAARPRCVTAGRSCALRARRCA